jgi:hypothetical protein
LLIIDMVRIQQGEDDVDNACRIWGSFQAHGIACGKRPACTQ